MTVDPHVVGRVGEHHPRLLAAHQQPTTPCRARRRRSVCSARVARHRPVGSAAVHPRAANRPRDRRLLRRARRPGCRSRDREAVDADVEADRRCSSAFSSSASRSSSQPALSASFVGDDIGPLLCRRHRLEPDAGHGPHAEKLRRLDPAVPGEDRVRGVDQHGVGEAERLDLAAICRTCFFEWVRALRAQGFRRVGSICSILCEPKARLMLVPPVPVAARIRAFGRNIR